MEPETNRDAVVLETGAGGEFKGGEFTVESDDARGRLDRFLAEKMGGVSRSRIQALIKSGEILLNGKIAKASEPVACGDKVSVVIPDAVPLAGLCGKDIPLDILYEDENLLVLNKAAGMVVHPGAGTDEDTLVHALLHHCKDLSGIGGVERPGIVHRLDKETSGCLVVAKNDIAHRSLAEQFADRKVKKVYLALVRGCPNRPWGTIDADIGRHPVHRQKMAVRENGQARAAVTDYRVLAKNEKMSLIECHPKTGRTHQIRVHLKHLGHPIVGDPIYGNRGDNTRHYLHAWKLEFEHPVSKKIVGFCAPVPPDFPILPPEEV